MLIIIEVSPVVNLINPGVIPMSLGNFTFNTLDDVSFELNTVFPNSARSITIVVFIRSGLNSGEENVNVWLWTECPENGTKDVKFKRGYRYSQHAYSFDSETLDFVYCPSRPFLQLKTNSYHGNVYLELFVVGYTNG